MHLLFAAADWWIQCQRLDRGELNISSQSLPSLIAAADLNAAMCVTSVGVPSGLWLGRKLASIVISRIKANQIRV